MTKKIYLETFEKCPGPITFPLLINNYNNYSYNFFNAADLTDTSPSKGLRSKCN